MWTVHDSCLPAVASCLGVDILFTDYGEETSLRLGHMARWCGAQYRQVRRQLGWRVVLDQGPTSRLRGRRQEDVSPSIPSE